MASQRKEQVEFREIKRTDVPFWHPVAQPVVEPSGSQWDKALIALSKGPETAILLKRQIGKNEIV
jgi:hypothetical protein